MGSDGKTRIVHRLLKFVQFEIEKENQPLIRVLPLENAECGVYMGRTRHFR